MMRFNIFLSLLSICILYGLYRKSRTNTCDGCLYNSCSTSFLILSCGRIQNIDKYFDIIRQYDESDRILSYSRLYGNNMDICFRGSRSFCRASHCSDECVAGDFISERTNTDDLVIIKDTETMGSQNTRITNYIVASDACYFNELDVKEMYTTCILSPFQGDCLATFSRNASIYCRT